MRKQRCFIDVWGWSGSIGNNRPVRVRVSFGHAHEGAASWQERLGGLTRGKCKHGWSRNGQRRQRGLMSSENWEKRVVWLNWEKVSRDTEEAATTSRCKFYENNADAMHMMLWDEMHDMNTMQNKWQSPTTEEITYRISGKGKSWS